MIRVLMNTLFRHDLTANEVLHILAVLLAKGNVLREAKVHEKSEWVSLTLMPQK